MLLIHHISGHRQTGSTVLKSWRELHTSANYTAQFELQSTSRTKLFCCCNVMCGLFVQTHVSSMLFWISLSKKIQSFQNDKYDK